LKRAGADTVVSGISAVEVENENMKRDANMGMAMKASVDQRFPN
jgi:hypothetical protein